MAPFVRQICAHLVNNNFGPGSKYAQRMEASPDFYGVIQSRCQEYLEQKMGKKAAGRPVPKAHASGVTRRAHARYVTGKLWLGALGSWVRDGGVFVSI